MTDSFFIDTFPIFMCCLRRSLLYLYIKMIISYLLFILKLLVVENIAIK